jgi:4-hydroxy-tetrahydrodipicolinate synthase
MVAAGTDLRDLGADGIVATAPYYYHATDVQTERHFRIIREEVGLPLVAYDIPVRVHVKLPLHVLVRLARDGVLAAVKDSSGDDALMQALIDATTDLGFPVLTGSELRAQAHLALGVRGTVPGLGNVDPAGFVRLYQASAAGDQETASREQARIAGLTDIEFAAVEPGTRSAIAAFKAALVLLGVIDSGAMAPPSAELTEAEVATISDRLAAAGLG